MPTAIWRPPCLMGTRQLAYFLAGAVIGCVLPQLMLTKNTVTYSSSEVHLETPPVSRQLLQSAEGKQDNFWNLKPNGQPFKLVRPPRRSQNRKIVRWAKDEINIAEVIKPLVIWTSDELTGAVARTWMHDAVNDITLFVPETSNAPIRQSEEIARFEKGGFNSAQQIRTFTGHEWKSDAGGILRTMAHLCDEFLADDVKKKTLAQFRWFVFTHDYNYIRLDPLRFFIRPLSLASPLCLARPVDSSSDFTTWSPRSGFILNQRAMSAVCPYVTDCKKYLGTQQFSDDVVLSRCLKTAGVQCSLSPDAHRYLVEITKEMTSSLINTSLVNLPALKHGLVYSVEESELMHLLFQSDKHSKLVQLNKRLEAAGVIMKEMDELKVKFPLIVPSPSPAGFDLKSSMGMGELHDYTANADIPWYSYDSNYAISSDLVGRHGQDRAAAFSKDVEGMLNVACHYCAAQQEQCHCLDMVSAHSRFRPSIGMEYRYDLLVKSSRLPAHEASPQRQVVRLLRPLGAVRVTAAAEHTPKTVHFLLPVTRQSTQFQAFMTLYENIVLAKSLELIALTIVFCGAVDEEREEIHESVMDPRSLVALYQHKYSPAKITFIELPQQKFSPAEAYVTASKSLPANALLFLADVDFVFSLQFVERCQLIADQGKQAYVPIPFYLHKGVSAEGGDMATLQKLLKKQHSAQPSGSFLNYAREAVCLYQSDFAASGWPGTDGSGDELVEKLKGRLQVIESPDPGLVHSWHVRLCSALPTKARRALCHTLQTLTDSPKQGER